MTSLTAALTDALTDRASTPHNPAIIQDMATGAYRYGSALNMGAGEVVAFGIFNLARGFGFAEDHRHRKDEQHDPPAIWNEPSRSPMVSIRICPPIRKASSTTVEIAMARRANRRCRFAGTP